MKKIYIKDLKNYFNQEIVLQGFIENIRDLQYVQFVIIKDNTGKVQLTIEKNEENKHLNNIILKTTIESTVKVTGIVLENPKVKLNGIEIIAKDILITSKSLDLLPINYREKDAANRETRLDYRFLDLRREDNNLLFRAQTFMENAMRQYWVNNNYIEIHSPKIASAAAEGGSEVFTLDYFGQKACLSQSPQLYKQMAMASNFDKVFEIGQVFRAENSHTSYHATEILMVDSEISWVESHHDVMDEMESWVTYFMKRLKENMGDEIKKVFNVELSDVDEKFPRIKFLDAKEILKTNFNYIGSNKEDFERKEEELVCQYAKEKYHSDFVFVTDYPYSARPFYTMKNEDGTTKSFDLLFKGIEITSGAQREHRYEILKEQIIEKGINPDTLNNYLEFFKYGCPPHGGFGFGMSRLLMQIFEIDNIREATFIYRGPTRITP
ncbi:MAG: aspartate--tRNA(Asn) ligase [Bacilli bacterium]